MKTRKTIKTLSAFLVTLSAITSGARAADLYWRTDGTSGGTWTSTYWSNPASATGGTAWTAGNNAVFTANSTLTFAGSTVGNVTVASGKVVTITQNGKLNLGGLVSTFDVGTGATLTWQTQTVSDNSSGGITKNGDGLLDLGSLTFATNMTGGFTLNAGTVIATGNKALGNGTLTLNGGTLQTTGTRTFAVTSTTIGGDFAFAGTGNANWGTGNIGLGSGTRTITHNTTSGSRQLLGAISGAGGLSFAGNGGAQIYLGNTANNFGNLTITGGEVVANGDGALGSGNAITLDGGRLTLASMDTSGNTSALSAASISSGRTIYLGESVGTSLSTQGITGVTTFNGAMTDMTGKTGYWAKQGAGILQLGGVSNYSGATAINNGILQLTTGNDRLPTGTVVSLGQAGSANLGTLDLNGRNQQIAGLVSTSGTNAGAAKNTVTSASPAMLTLNTSGSNTYAFGDNSATNSGVLTGALSLTKSGTGTQILGGTNTYNGTTAITRGTLSVTGSLASPSTSVSSGATLTGNGTIAGALTTLGNTAVIAPGVAAAGTLTVGSLDVTDGATVNIALGTTPSLLVISGLLNGSSNAGDIKFNFTDAGGLLTGQAYTVLTFGSQSGLDYSDLAAISLPASLTLDSSFGTGGWYISTNGLQVQLIPEPQTIGLGGLGLLLLMRRRRRNS